MQTPVMALVFFAGLVACSDGGGALPLDSHPPTADATPPPGFDAGPAVPDGSRDRAVDTNVPLAGDCTDPGRTCFPPFICRVNPDTGAKACLSPVGDIPPCTGTPPGQVVPFSTDWNTKLVVHWPLQPGCIATSFAPALKPKGTDIGAAVKAWHDVPCSALCLHPPKEMASSPDVDRRERRIHFRPGTPSSPGAPAETLVTYEAATSRLYAVEVVIAPSQQGSLTVGGLVSLVGFAVGLSQAPGTADSVMKPFSSLLAPGGDDKAALCKLYAAPGFCAD